MFEVGQKVVIGPESLLEGKYQGVTGTILELPEDNPVGAYRFKPDVDFPNEPETWLMFDDELQAVS